MTNNTPAEHFISDRDRDLRFLRRYYTAVLLPALALSDTNRIIGVILASAVCTLRGGNLPATVARAHALIGWTLFQRVSDLSQTPAWTLEAKRLAKALRIAAEVLGGYTGSEPASLNDVLESYPKVSSVTLERLWLDGEHLTATADLIADEARERIAELES